MSACACACACVVACSCAPPSPAWQSFDRRRARSWLEWTDKKGKLRSDASCLPEAQPEEHAPMPGAARAATLQGTNVSSFAYGTHRLP